MSKLIPGFNDLATVNPGLAKEWHPTKNGDLKPSDITAGSGMKVWWRCAEGHEWECDVNHRKQGGSCPICAGKRVLPGFNDLATTHPKLAAEWHPTKNGTLTPEQVIKISNKKVWWLGKCGHEWETKISNRSAKKYGCPICSNQLLLEGYNDLATTHPKLAAEWHPTKNGDLTPSQIMAGSGQKVWWQCAKGHEWQAVPNSRSTSGTGCPECAKETQTSFAEQAIFFYLNQITTAVNRYLLNGKTEIDIYLPEYKIGIEYDGGRFHKGKVAERREAQKNATLQSFGITLIRIKEVKNLTGYVDNESVIYCKWSANLNYVTEIVTKILNYLSDKTKAAFKIDVDAARDRWLIYEQYINSVKNNSLLVLYPELVKEWHPTKNGTLTPDQVTAGSGMMVWWRCAEGHEWQAAPNHRNKGIGCPYCSGRIAIPGKTDLATTYPELAAQWHPTKNGDLTPSQIMRGSGKKVWWLCPICGAEWEASPNRRSKRKNIDLCCPKCSYIQRGKKLKKKA